MRSSLVYCLVSRPCAIHLFIMDQDKASGVETRRKEWSCKSLQCEILDRWPGYTINTGQRVIASSPNDRTGSCGLHYNDICVAVSAGRTPAGLGDLHVYQQFGSQDGHVCACGRWLSLISAVTSIATRPELKFVRHEAQAWSTFIPP